MTAPLALSYDVVFLSGQFLFCQLTLLLLLPLVVYCIFVLDDFCLFTCFPVAIRYISKPQLALLPFLFKIFKNFRL